MSVSIVAKQLGFDSVILYLECHGWMFWTQGGKATIQYCKLEQVIARLGPTGEMVELVMNFKAMVDKLYTYVEQQGIKNIYTHKPAIRFLKKNSFYCKAAPTNAGVESCIRYCKDILSPACEQSDEPTGLLGEVYLLSMSHLKGLLCFSVMTC